MIKYYCSLFLFFSFIISDAQVGINTSNPKTTLDVSGNASNSATTDGIMAPRMTLAELNAKTGYGADQTSALVYITDVTGSTVTSTAQVTDVGYYYFSGTAWLSWAPKSGLPIFTATLGSGAGSNVNATLSANAFRTVPLPTVVKNLGGGVWNSVNNTYAVPKTGTYLIKSTIRLTDGSASRNIFQSVHTSNVDIPDGIWQTNPAPTGGGRWTMLYTRLAFFNAGDLLRLYIYSTGTSANLSDASLNITLINEN